MKTKTIFFAAILFLFSLFNLSAQEAPFNSDVNRGTVIGKKAPALNLPDANGQMQLLDDVKAKYTILFFWDYTCYHCQEAAPVLLGLYHKNKTKGVEVVAVGLNTNIEQWKQYINENKLDWINVSNPDGKVNIMELYDVYSFPFVYILNEKKEIIAKNILVTQIAEFMETGKLNSSQAASLRPDINSGTELNQKIKERSSEFAKDVTIIQGAGTTYYVRPGGSDSHSCSQAQTDNDANAKGTIQGGINCVTGGNGDIVIIHGGTYATFTTQTTLYDASKNGTSWSNAATIKAAPNETVWLRGLIDMGDAVRYWIIDGINIDGGDQSYNAVAVHDAGFIRLMNSEYKNIQHSGILGCGGGNCEFLNLQIHHIGVGPNTACDNPPVNGGQCHGIYTGHVDVLIDGCHIYDTEGHGITAYSGSGTMTIRNCIFHDNKPGRGGSAAQLLSSQSVRFYNNLVYNTSGAGLWITGSDPGVYNNTFYATNGGAHSANGSITNGAFRNNIFYLTGGGVQVTGSGYVLSNNPESDPKFVNAAGSDFHLAVGSPAIDAAGTALSSLFTTDLEGTSRPQGSAWDIGAYEYKSGGSCIPSAPTVGTITQPTCSLATGSVVLNGLPSSGTWTVTRSPGGITTTGTGASTTIIGLATGTYNFKVSTGSTCTSTSSANVVINTQQTPGPYLGVAASIPGTIEAENYDNCGQNIGYYDNDTGNVGGFYRTDDVDIFDDASEGSYYIGGNMPGEWLKYSVNVTTTGVYTLEARITCPGNGGTFHVESNGIDITGPLTIPNTGGWNNWQTITKPSISLTKGQQLLRLVMDANGPSGFVGDFNYLKFTAETATGIAQIISTDRINIYPNPGTGEFRVSGLQFPVDVRIYNMLGEIIENRKLETENLNLDLAPGIYFLEVNVDGPASAATSAKASVPKGTSAGKQKYVQKIIKQ